jgi:hypothetical protein
MTGAVLRNVARRIRIARVAMDTVPAQLTVRTVIPVPRIVTAGREAERVELASRVCVMGNAIRRKKVRIARTARQATAAATGSAKALRIALVAKSTVAHPLHAAILTATRERTSAVVLTTAVRLHQPKPIAATA